jgi:hypothetical protein
MILVKASKESEAGVLPTAEQIAEMGKYNDELVKAGVLLALDGLQPSSKGARIKFSGGKRTVTDGPFAEAKELIAGFWVIQVKSKEEALEWASRIPFDGGEEVELRQVFDASDFPSDILPPEQAAREEEIRAHLDANAPKPQ